MKLSKERYPVSVLKELQDSIDVRPEYQRPLVWTLKQKRLLIDSILRGYDVPKMYWHRQHDEAEFEFHVVDGQQRLTTIWEFCNDGFALAKDSDPVEGILTARLKYSDFNAALKKRLHLYSFDVVIVEEATQNDEEDEVREMFLRLQNGTTLKAQEKRNAMTGRMRVFVKQTAEHPFFESCKFGNTRFTYDHVAAQMICTEMAGAPTSVRDSDLNRMYAEHSDFDPKGNVARKVRRTLDYLKQAFPEHTRELERYNAITLYSLVSSLIDNYVHQGTENRLADWFISFEAERRADMDAEEDNRDVQLVEYQRLTSYSTDAEESLAKRLEQMQRRFFLSAPDIELTDPTRIFSDAQRLAIYRRDDARCQLRIKCDGTQKLKWNNWHADHKTPHSIGGKTTVENGQVACPDCNFAKGAKNEMA